VFRKSIIFVCAASLLMITGCTSPSTSATQPEGDYVVDVNDTYGFEVRRPAGWQGEGIPNMYDYIPDVEALGEERSIRISVLNYETYAEAQGENTIVIPYSLYEMTPSLEGWTQAMVNSWESNGADVELLSELPNAKVYHVEQVEQWTNVIGLVEEDGHPMSIGISARNLTLEELREMGLLAELEAMIASLEYREGG
jgi:hypothetical protein